MTARPPIDRVAGAVLTGGASRRMGRDKALIEVGGVALARRVADVLVAAGVDPVVAVGGDRRALGALGLTVVEDRAPGAGPLGGIATALAHLEPVARRVVVVACDLPRLDVASVRSLVETPSDADVVVASSGRLEPLCAVWSVEACRSAVESRLAGGDRAVHLALADLTTVMVELPGLALANANRPEDLPGE